MVLILLLNVGVGCLLAALSVPLILNKIGPNPWYGFRVERTLRDPAVWYAANAYAAWWLLGLGCVLAAATVALYFVPGLDVVTYALVCAAVSLGGLAVSLVASFRYLRSLPP